MDQKEEERETWEAITRKVKKQSSKKRRRNSRLPIRSNWTQTQKHIQSERKEGILFFQFFHLQFSLPMTGRGDDTGRRERRERTLRKKRKKRKGEKEEGSKEGETVTLSPLSLTWMLFFQSSLPSLSPSFSPFLFSLLLMLICYQLLYTGSIDGGQEMYFIIRQPLRFLSCYVLSLFTSLLHLSSSSSQSPQEEGLQLLVFLVFSQLSLLFFSISFSHPAVTQQFVMAVFFDHRKKVRKRGRRQRRKE